MGSVPVSPRFPGAGRTPDLEVAVIRQKQGLRLAAVLLVTAAVEAVALPRVVPRSVISGVMSYMSTRKYGFPLDFVGCPDGTYWLAGLRREMTIEGGSPWVVRQSFDLRRLGPSGEQLGTDITLNDPRLHGIEERHDFLGTDRRGNLLLYLGRYPHLQLAKVGASGILWVQDSVPYVEQRNRFLDGDEKVWLVRYEDSCAVVDAASDSRSTLTTIRYAERFDSPQAVPAFLNLSGSLVGFLGEHAGRQVIACVRPGDANTLILYRLDRNQLTLIDSGRVNMSTKVWGATDTLSIPGAFNIVAAADGGYFVYRSRYNQLPPPSVVAFRVDSHLRPVTQGAPGTLRVEPISALPKGARLDVVLRRRDGQESFDGHALTQTVQIALDFIGFGTDGRLYYERAEDSLVVRISEQR